MDPTHTTLATAVIPTFADVVNAAPELTLHKIYAGQDITVDVLSIATSIIGILVGAIGIFQGYKIWRRRQKMFVPRSRCPMP